MIGYFGHARKCTYKKKTKNKMTLDDLLKQADSLKLAGRHDEAINLANKMILMDMEYVEAYEEIGDNYLSLREYDRAMKALKHAIKIRPSSPNALYLSAAGVGTLGLIDMDRVDVSNLQRQIIHSTPDQEKLKVQSAKEKINALNPDVEVVTYTEKLSSKNVKEINRKSVCRERV